MAHTLTITISQDAQRAAAVAGQPAARVQTYEVPPEHVADLLALPGARVTEDGSARWPDTGTTVYPTVVLDVHADGVRVGQGSGRERSVRLERRGRSGGDLELGARPADAAAAIAAVSSLLDDLRGGVAAEAAQERAEKEAREAEQVAARAAALERLQREPTSAALASAWEHLSVGDRREHAAQILRDAPLAYRDTPTGRAYVAVRAGHVVISEGYQGTGALDVPALDEHVRRAATEDDARKAARAGDRARRLRALVLDLDPAATVRERLMAGEGLGALPEAEALALVRDRALPVDPTGLVERDEDDDDVEQIDAACPCTAEEWTVRRRLLEAAAPLGGVATLWHSTVTVGDEERVDTSVLVKIDLGDGIVVEREYELSE